MIDCRIYDKYDNLIDLLSFKDMDALNKYKKQHPSYEYEIVNEKIRR